jgi:hypothetical protein
LIAEVLFQIKEYGNISGFFLGTQPVVVLGDDASIKEAFQHEALAARPGFPLFEDARGGFCKTPFRPEKKLFGSIFHPQIMDQFPPRNILYVH